ncbi:TetR family transcriptional regulator [Siculibacillus lacustris]|uniref:TetR family transcriptional regulator n=1 Tax=Siculibacillus lacustris TaxID=1549641 RepID=A0A4Q9VNR0_9HYPH|nr:TetR family transcriptional regulator C-terminal domain-containing protein [Siculibacillus lacustris]TBW36459.1 TetR family transcriptional regulator [Siculibacillus lacustris]
MTPHLPKYRRAHPEDRRADLVEATIACLAEHGHAGVSVRRIAARAGVSAGLVNHHFEGIESLVAAAYERLSNDVLGRVLVRVAAETEPRRRLSAYFAAIFSDGVLDPGLLKVWVVFWSLLPHAEPLRVIQKRTWADYRRSLETVLADCAPPGASFDPGLTAFGLAALMDGLWLQWGLDPGSYRAEDAIALCEAFADQALARVRP